MQASASFTDQRTLFAATPSLAFQRFGRQMLIIIIFLLPENVLQMHL